jgi:hypothetical protein
MPRKGRLSRRMYPWARTRMTARTRKRKQRMSQALRGVMEKPKPVISYLPALRTRTRRNKALKERLTRKKRRSKNNPFNTALRHASS